MPFEEVRFGIVCLAAGKKDRPAFETQEPFLHFVAVGFAGDTDAERKDFFKRYLTPPRWGYGGCLLTICPMAAP